MACSGHNHRPTCSCPIGNPDRPSRQRSKTPYAGESEHRLPPKRRVKQSQPKICRCGSTVYGVWPRSGFFWAISVTPLIRHTCDYTRILGRPKVAKSQAAEEGWLPFNLVSMELVENVAKLEIFSLPLGLVVVRVEDAEGLAFPSTPMFRQAAIDDVTIELGSRNEGTGELTPLQFLGQIVEP